MAITQSTKSRLLVGRLMTKEGIHYGDGLLIRQTARVNITAPADDSETDTGLDLPSDARILDVFLVVNTAEATGATPTLDVGLDSGEANGDADGFLVGVDVSSTGFVQGTLDSGGQTLGALLTADEDGAGTLVPEPHIIDTAVSVTVTAGSDDFVELDADIFITYEKPDDTSTS